MDEAQAVEALRPKVRDERRGARVPRQFRRETCRFADDQFVVGDLEDRESLRQRRAPAITGANFWMRLFSSTSPV